MEYKVKLNGQTFFNTSNGADKYKLTEAIVDKEAGVGGSFTLSIPPCNCKYGKFHKLKDYVDIYRNGEIYWSGRVYDIEDSIETIHTITVESIFAVLVDSVARPQIYEYTTCREVFRSFIANHNNQVDPDKQLKVGRITVDDDPCYRKYQKIEKTSKRIADLVKSYGGRVEVRREPDGLYIDWLKSFDRGCSQAVDFGKNILDIKKIDSPGNIVTVLIPEGAKVGDGNVTIESVNDGKDYIEAPPELIDEYGRITDTHSWPDVTTPIQLLHKGEEYIVECCKPNIQIKVSAVDLADTGLEVDNFDVGQMIKVRSEYHGIDDYFECNKQRLNLLDPSDNKLELGTVVRGYIESRKQELKNVEEAVEEISFNYTTKTDVENAIKEATDDIKTGIGGYVIQHDADGDGITDEILILDTPDISTAVSVWRFNKNGLGHSSTGYDGTYELALTMDDAVVANYVTAQGLSAEILKAGILRAQQGDTWWNLNTGEFHFGSDVQRDSSKIFYDTPVAPYYVGDLYVTGHVMTTARVGYAIAGQAIVGKDGTYGIGGDILICAHSNMEGSYRQEDFVLVTNYIEDAEYESLKGMLLKAQADIAINKEGLTSKVSYTDYNGKTIASIINQSGNTVLINSQHIRLMGAVNLNDVIKFDENGAYTDRLVIKGFNRSPYTYTTADMNRISQIIMGTVHPTAADYAKLDLNGDGRISSLDYVDCRAIVNAGGIYETYVTFEPNSSKDVITIRDNIGHTTHIGASAASTSNLLGRRLSLSESMFRTEKVTAGPYTLSGSASGTYSKEEKIKINVKDGYELVGVSGFNIRPDTGSTAIMCNVYKSYCDGENFCFGVTNTGASTQTIYVDYYVMMSHTKEEIDV